jgi:phage terminase large subunit
MTEAQYQQEIECNPNAAVQGTYYSDLIAKAEVEGRIGDYPHTVTEMVHVSSDLGFTDSTAFWFWQLDEYGPYMIDYHEADGKPLEYYFDMLRAKPYEYADIWLPHDAVARTLQTGRSTVEQFLAEKFPAKVVPRLAVQHGIDAGRLMLKNMRFNRPTTHDGIEALRAYRRSWNEKTQQFANTPLHDWASNGADAFRYFSLVTDDSLAREVAKEIADPILKAPEYTLNDLFEDKESNWRTGIIRI